MIWHPGDNRLPVLEGLWDEKDQELRWRARENIDVVMIAHISFAHTYVILKKWKI